MKRIDPKKFSPTLYEVEGSRETVSLDRLHAFLGSKGYRGGKGQFFMAQFLRSKGKKLYEISGNKRFEVGR